MPNKYMAFWFEDENVLSGEVDRVWSNNTCKLTKEYLGRVVVYEFILPYDEGIVLEEKVKWLTDFYNAERLKLEKECKRLVGQTITESLMNKSNTTNGT